MNKSIDFKDLTVNLKKEFNKNNSPIEVSFKDLVKIKSGERLTHQIHSYPAKLLVHIPYFFLNNSYFSKVGDIIIDPFNGSGTVALETIISGKIFYGADANPIANLISKVKIIDLELDSLKLQLNRILSTSKFDKNSETPEVRNLNFWFPKNTIISLSNILNSINIIENEKEREFFLVSFSSIIKKVSYCDTRISVPVKLNIERYSDEKIKKKIIAKLNGIENCDVYEKFHHACMDNINRLSELYKLNLKLSNFKYLSNDARNLKIAENEKMPDSFADLIITSPPYAGAQKYIRASSLNLGWTKLAELKDLKILENLNIGREVHRKSEIIIKPTGILSADYKLQEIGKKNLDRAYIAYKYLEEMKVAINEMYRVLKKGGHIILIIGNNKITGKEFNTQEYICEYAKSIGLRLELKLIDNIKSYGLMTKRNKTADVISREYVLIFKKL